MSTPVAVASRAGGFVVAPITTELQRLGGSRADAAVVARLSDARPLNVDLLREVLTVWPRAGAGKLSFNVTCVTEPGQELRVGTDRADMQPVVWRHESLIQSGLRGVAREAGFGEAAVSICGAGPEERGWDAICADFEAHAASDLASDEPGLGDAVVKVYPVRTTLSRFLFLGADCVVHLEPPRVPASTEGLAEIEEHAIRYVEQQQLERRQAVCFTFAGRVPEREGDSGQQEWLASLDQLMQIFLRGQVWIGRMRFASWVSVALA